MTQTDRPKAAAQTSRPAAKSQKRKQRQADEAPLPQRERIHQKLRERASALAAPLADTARGAVVRLITFGWRRQRWTVDGERVDEVIPIASPIPLPGLPSTYLSLIRYRGEVFPLVDIAALFGIGDGDGKPTHALIVTDNGAAIAIAADAVEGLTEIEASSIAAMPPDAAKHSALQGLTPDLAILFDPLHLPGDSRLVVNDQPLTPSRMEGKA